MAEKQFNTAGPSKPELHYLLDPLERVDLQEIEALIEAQRYFVLHAPRQTGKTTVLLALMQHLNTHGRYRALYANIETAQAARGNVERGIQAACSAIARSAQVYLGDARLDDWLLRGEGRAIEAEEKLSRLLAHWSQLDPAHPAVLLLDEVDALVGDTLISLLRQIRAGYAQRPQAFPQTVVLCGVREERVHRVISRLLASEHSDDTLPTDDVEYVADLGLITTRPQLRIANRIYREVIPRELTWTRQITIAHEQAWYLTPERRLDMPKLLAAFQQFFRENADAWIERFQYKEAGPQLLLQAFLQRIVNGGRRISREYGLGRRRTDLLIEWPIDEAQGLLGPLQRVVLELKIVHKSLEATLHEGLAQTAQYADHCGADEAHLIVFDRRPGIPWDDKIWQRTEQVGSRTVGVWGM
ncbi:AAA family ATPase [Tepidimonas aquatica]|uniref:AAA+ ATPase domain-containing protein n=1 Tax=Tepidimonas aquatica TaxID=247482 RepID=A0A554WL09_9BURK|nr:AAA family ATPase [Tepidimonas aquatica]TSE24277.1 hypothetical protein Taqua_01614 [Tepidimonas aquatica]